MAGGEIQRQGIVARGIMPGQDLVSPLHRGRENRCNASPCKSAGPGDAPWSVKDLRRETGHGSWKRETQGWNTAEEERGLWVLQGWRGGTQTHIRGGELDSHASKNGQRNHSHWRLQGPPHPIKPCQRSRGRGRQQLIGGRCQS